MSILELKNLSYSYDGIHPILKDITYTFEQGKVYAIMGKSGAGKTTLLSLLSGLAKPTSGTILFQDKDITTIDRYHYRSKYVGVVFQGFNLLPQLTAVENVELSMDISGMKIKDRCEVAMNLLDKVELDEVKANRRVLKLSGGEQQRVAIARALSYNPDILLADEPTGNLDGETQDAVMNIFLRLAREENKCVIIVTHSPEVAHQADIVYELKSAKCTDLSPLQ
ncbi:ABC transporter ATP-binding protein [Caproicibacterium sp. BJN0003]|uniref:ABC transporter ATP-binding protein n=1 Tax=Caproicibacterium sp. BJN0003 TaxID=2994078 RepID=UPI00225C1006|nr:ABC transporter ATP-binding protein [Caproicibacterium sp. BJN0003]UZT83182.1 ABC transporter ATP-binding protein [Caproicibacterium sp. BJN0003]